MKRIFISALLVFVGAASWWLLSRSVRFTVRSWDVRFGSAARHALDQLGAKNEDILSSVNELRRDAQGEWIVYRLKIRLADQRKRAELLARLRASGADVAQRGGADPVLVISRGPRVYQEIELSR